MARMARMTRKRLGEILIEEGVITEEHLLTALAEQRKSGELLGQVLVDLAYATEYDIAKAIVTQFAWPFISVKNYFIREEVAALIPPQICRQYHVVPMEKMGNVLAIVAGSTLNDDIRRELERITGCRVRIYVGTYSDVKEALEKYHGSGDYVPAASPLEGVEIAALPPEPVEAPPPPPAEAAAPAPAPRIVSVPDADGAETPAAAKAADEAAPAEAAEEAPPAEAAEGKDKKAIEEEAAALDQELSSLGSMLLGDDE